MRIEEYLNLLTGQIRCEKAKDPVKREIQAHIEDQIEAFIAGGMQEEEAQEAAVLEMGDPVAVGGDLDRLHRPKMPWGMVVFASVLGAAGLILQCFLRLRFTNLYWSGNSVISPRQFFYLIISILVMVAVCRLDYSRIGYYAKGIYLALFSVLLLGIVFGAVPVNGARRWIALPFGMTINATMLLLLFVPLYAAILYLHRGQGYFGSAGAGVRWMVPPLFLAWLCQSFYTMGLLLPAFLAVYLLAVYKGWYRVSKKIILGSVLAGIIFLAGAALWLVFTNPDSYQAARLLALFTGRPQSYQAEMLRNVCSGSRWIGAAADEVRAPLSYLSPSDYTLAYVIADYGILAGVVMMSLILALVGRFLYLALKQKNQMGMLIGVGCCIVFALQWVLYAAENLGLLLWGSYCPFLTYGGSGMLVTYMICGLMLSIYRYEDTFPEAGFPAEEEARRGYRSS